MLVELAYLDPNDAVTRSGHIGTCGEGKEGAANVGTARLVVVWIKMQAATQEVPI